MSLQPGDSLQFAASTPEVRVANDGKAYTYTEYIDFYGQDLGERRWNSAPLYRAPQESSAPQPAEAPALSQSGSTERQELGSVSQHSLPFRVSPPFPPVGQTEGCGASQPATSPPALGQAGTSDASQRAAFPEGSGVVPPPPPGRPSASAAVPPPPPPPPQSQSSNALQLAVAPAPVLLTLAELDSMPKQPGFGGKAACQKQRELRQVCLQNGMKFVDLSNDAWPWKQVMKGLDATVAQELVGPGVTAFSFRLLEHVRDHNYVRPGDTGDRHVFELVRSDGSLYHLHFHKNGRMDTPVKSGASGNIADMFRTGGASQPADLTQSGGATQPAGQAYPLGKSEAHLTLQRLLEQQPGRWTELTDETSFHWNRFLRTQTCGAEILARDTRIERVVALMWSGKPAVAFCRSDGQTFIVIPSAMKQIPPYTQLATPDFLHAHAAV